MQPSAEENRRAIRKALRARIDGDATYVVAHPESQAWLRRHPAVDATLWHGGLVLQRSIGDGDGAREVRLDIERDPLEVLRMGTYVGTCLGLGGSQAYSAAAVVLDINKCVVYCRDASGTVLARQLLAISEREQLYCFAVYPDSTQDEIVELFWEYDRAFANALGLPLYDPSVDATDGEVDIAYVLAKGWWYDSAVEVEGRGSGASPASVVSK